ncbi:MAG: DUF1080 domain-containing protein [Bacteroidales bacterium]|nr:MAG: DUF1080 domain-containing protein [Bacteroidales bacterium]
MKQNNSLICSIILLFLFTGPLASQEPEETEDWSGRPDIVTPGKRNHPPSDAIILFDGNDLSAWSGENGEPEWKVFGRSMTVVGGTGSIETKQRFGDVQLHIEWRAPRKVIGEGQERGNSGIFLMDLYEVQVLDSYNNETYYNGQAGSIYKQHIPLVNACFKPGEWQTYDIIFTSPTFNEDSTLKSPGYLTVIHNGILIQNHVELKGPTVYIGQPSYKFHDEKLPLTLQDHGNPVSYRNIWIREL